jgi:hypothetical protein
MTGWGRPVVVKGQTGEAIVRSLAPFITRDVRQLSVRLHRIGRCQPRLRPELVALLLLVVRATLALACDRILLLVAAHDVGPR